jgi:hypothetical protein
VYSVEWEEQALEQAAALPAEVFPYYAELVTLLAYGPGKSHDRTRGDACVSGDVLAPAGASRWPKIVEDSGFGETLGGYSGFDQIHYPVYLTP